MDPCKFINFSLKRISDNQNLLTSNQEQLQKNSQSSVLYPTLILLNLVYAMISLLYFRSFKKKSEFKVILLMYISKI